MTVSVSSSIVSYGGAAATSTFLPNPSPSTSIIGVGTPHNYFNMLYGYDPTSSNMFTDRIGSCAPTDVERIRQRYIDEEENGIPPIDEYDTTQFRPYFFDRRRRRGALFCRSGTWLEIVPSEYDDSTWIHGTKEENSKFSIVEFISVAMSLISIRGVETQQFVCMDPTGALYATPSTNYSTECVFIEEMMENYYNLYSSCEYSDRDNPWYIEFRRSGKPRRGPNTKKRRKASHFVVVHHDLNRLRRPNQPNGNDVTDLVVASLFHQPPTHPLFQWRRTAPKPPTHRISSLRAKVETKIDYSAQRKRRRDRKKRRREERLLREEKKRRDRKNELRILRAKELRLSRPSRYRNQMLSSRGQRRNGQTAYHHYYH